MDANNNDSEEWIAFDRTYSRILDMVLKDKRDEELAIVGEYLKHLFDYNVTEGKRNRGLFVVMTYRLLNEDLSEEQLESARILGWTVEILQAFALIVDDVMDQSLTRRGKACWYRRPEIGLSAINDGLILEQECYHILEQRFSKHPFYAQILNLMHKITRFTTYGQNMDMTSADNNRPKFDLFTQTRYKSIVKYKTSYYSFVLPVRLAMYLSLNNSESDHKTAERLLLKIGHLFQTQDDFLDCFGDPQVMGKVGTDIEEGKCCWPVVTALGLCNEEQRKVLESSYGLKNEESVNAVKAVYKDLNLFDVYHRYEDKIFEDIRNEINALEDKNELNPHIFGYISSKIYKREK